MIALSFLFPLELDEVIHFLGDPGYGFERGFSWTGDEVASRTEDMLAFENR